MFGCHWGQHSYFRLSIASYRSPDIHFCVFCVSIIAVCRFHLVKREVDFSRSRYNVPTVFSSSFTFSSRRNYGRVLIRARARSLISRICLSILGTCSLAAVVLRLTPWLIRSRRRHSNSRSISAVLGLKPRALYSEIFFNNDLMRFGSDLFVTYSMVVNFILREIVVTNGNPFTNMISAVMVTFLLRSNMALGIST
jgi:hypothetical protein